MTAKAASERQAAEASTEAVKLPVIAVVEAFRSAESGTRKTANA